MNDIPIMWAQELKAAYPAKSGPVGWASMKLLLACRRALMESTWTEIIDGCKRYKAYCEASGREGTEFVQNPLRFISDGCHLEDFAYQAPQTKEQLELAAIKERDRERMEKAREAGGRIGITPLPLESVGSFETRVKLASDGVGRTDNRVLRSKLSDLTARMRISK